MNPETERKIIHFFNNLDRSFFIDNENRDLAQQDRALPIGYGQTISQPSLVLSMTLQLDLNDQCRVLEIGTGSGYQTVLLAEFSGEVYTVERIAQLSLKAQKRIEQMAYDNVHFLTGDGSQGWPEHQPYDRIIVTAAAGRLPGPLIVQLACGGKMVIPVGPPGNQELLLIEKLEDNTVSCYSIGLVSFVEFRGSYGWNTSDE
ncbi:MAG: protein-L-isoaspartate(D-aspartate) O-methyltransferase [Syntrophomonadaceae bacterium]